MTKLNTPSSNYSILLVGGSGTRLWPFSRSFAPKQFIGFKLEKTLIQEAVARIQRLDVKRITSVTHQDNYHEVHRQLALVNPDLNSRILAEPERKNTLPAIAWAVAEIERENPEAILTIFPADHHIENVEALKTDMEKAVTLSQEGYLVTLGIKPSYAETGFGYIHTSFPFKSGFIVQKFTEKPDLKTAKEYLTRGSFYWNSGIFVFRAKDFQAELKKHEPEIFEAIQRIIASDNNPKVVKDEYSKIKNISIDYGIMERAQKVAMVPATFDWSDLGGWNSVFDILPKNENHNATQGDIISLDTHGSLLMSKKGTLATIGLNDMVVIQTDDAVLVCPKNRSQDVKKIVEMLKEKNHPVTETHPTVRRPWGTYTVLEEGPHYKIKKIVVDPRQKLSLQRHAKRSEHWVVVEGIAQVTCDEKVSTLNPNESTFISPGAKHRLENPGELPLSIIEVQTGSYVGEDDIERFEDVYGRK